jgi:hypothetical protein
MPDTASASTIRFKQPPNRRCSPPEQILKKAKEAGKKLKTSLLSLTD